MNVVAIMVSNTIGEVGMAIGPGATPASSAGDAPVTDDASVDAHAVTVVTGALMPVAGHTIKQGAGPDQLRLQGG